MFLVDDGALVVAVEDLRELLQREDASLVRLYQPRYVSLEQIPQVIVGRVPLSHDFKQAQRIVLF